MHACLLACRAQRERLLAASTQQEDEQQQGSKTYKGMNAYVDYKAGFRREGHTVGAEKGSGSHGPLRGNVFVRSTAR
jgi:RING finger protein 113A